MMPGVPTCRKVLPGTYIDYHIISEGMVAKVKPGTAVDVTASARPRKPAELELLQQLRYLWERVVATPRPLPKQAHPGYARFPWGWPPLRASFSSSPLQKILLKHGTKLWQVSSTRFGPS